MTDSDEIEAQDYLNRLLWDMDEDDSVEEIERANAEAKQFRAMSPDQYDYEVWLNAKRRG